MLLAVGKVLADKAFGNFLPCVDQFGDAVLQLLVTAWNGYGRGTRNKRISDGCYRAFPSLYVVGGGLRRKCRVQVPSERHDQSR